MLYHLFEWLNNNGYKIPGGGLFQFISFRVIMSLIISLVVATIIGKGIIKKLQSKQLAETVRELGLAGEQQKKGTPTMGGIIILLAILVPTILFANLTTVYILLIILCTIWLGGIGFIDDYLKLKSKRDAQKKSIEYKKKDSDGLAGKFKIFGQVTIGIIIGATLYFNPNVVVKREVYPNQTSVIKQGEKKVSEDVQVVNGEAHEYVTVKSPITTIPFVKSHEFNYAKFLPASLQQYTWVVYILVVIFIITAVSNSVNITDGLDGLATGISAIVGICLAIFAYVSGNIKLADYLNIMYIPNLGELSIFIAAFVGACVGFLWFNAYPAQVFMGDTGSLALGGIIGALALMVRKELLLPIFCFTFFIEIVSVMAQVAFFKYTKRKFGVGKRLFLMSPLHHHFQKMGYHESKISVRFWIVTIVTVAIAIITLKLR